MTDDLCKAGIMIEEMAKKASEGDCGEKDGRPIMEHVERQTCRRSMETLKSTVM